MTLQTVRRRVEVNAPLEAVLSLTLDAERYPEFAPSIHKTELLWHDQQNRKYLIRYTSTIPVINKLAVSEQEVSYDLEHTVFHFRETSGSFGRFEGYRRLCDLSHNRSAIESEVRYSFGGNRLVAQLVNKATQGVVQSNLEHIQEGIKHMAETGRAEPLSVVLRKLNLSARMLVEQGLSVDLLGRYGLALTRC